MVHVPFQTIVYLYVFAGLAWIAAIWLWGIFRGRALRRKARRFQLHCWRCALEWEDRSAESLPKCPACGSLNERATQETL